MRRLTAIASVTFAALTAVLVTSLTRHGAPKTAPTAEKTPVMAHAPAAAALKPHAAGDAAMASSDDPLAAEFAQIKDGLRSDPHDPALLARLESMHVQGHFPDEIVAFVTELYDTGNGAPVLAEALGELHAQAGNYGEAAAWFRKSVEYSTRPMHAYFMLTYSELKTDDYEAAAASARAQKLLAEDYVAGRRDVSLIKEKIGSGDLAAPCMLEAVALVKLGDDEQARAAIDGCGKGVVPEAERGELLRSLPQDLDELREMSVDEILD